MQRVPVGRADRHKGKGGVAGRCDCLVELRGESAEL